MFIALRDLWFARGRFALMATVVALLAMLMVLLTGLSTGLVDDNVSGVAELPADHLSFSAESGVAFNRSIVERAQWDNASRIPGVEAAAPLGTSLYNAQAYSQAADAAAARDEIARTGTSKTKGTPVDLSLFGVEPDSFIAPPVTDGAGLGARPDGVIASAALVKKGVKVGDTIVLDRVGTPLVVVGTTEKANYGHVPVLYVPLGTWQAITFGAKGQPLPQAGAAAGVPDLATAVAIKSAAGTDFTGLDHDAGLTTVTKQAAFDGSPGYKEETGTLTMIKCFLYLIGAMLVGAFFTVWTIQRQPEIALVKALGGSTGYLLRDALAQALIVLVGATAVGVVVGRLFGFLIPNGAPFSFAPGSVLLAGLFVIVLGLAGSLLSIRRITRVDPLLALGGAR